MATNYPTALDTLTNPTANDSLNSPSVPHATQHANANDAIEAIEATIGITNSADQASIQYKLAGTISVANAASSTASTALATAQSAMPNTTTAAGTLISGATAKSTPVNADVLALSDSAASNVLKKLSWSDLKTTILTALDSVFAKLAGLAGGQTLIGGTQPSENLTLQSTSHATRGKLLLGSSSAYDEANVRIGVGTQAPSAKIHSLGTTEQLRLGYDASNYASTTVSSLGQVTYSATGNQFTFKGSSGTATTGADLITNGSFAASLSGWTDSGSSWAWNAGVAAHTPGSASTLSQAFSVTSGQLYALRFTLARTAGNVTVSVGSDTIPNRGTTNAFTFTSASTYRRGFIASATSSVGVVFTPSSDFNGSIDDVQLVPVTTGSVTPTIRLQDSGGNSTVEMRASPVSQYNVSIGNNTLRSLLSGFSNAIFGYDAGRSLVDGFTSTMVGVSAGQSAINPQSVVLIGASCGVNLINPSQTVAVGTSAARYLADGSTALTRSENCVYLGAMTRASAEDVTNENVFGYNATGIGSNSTVLGSSAVTKCQIFGDLILDKTVTAAGTTGAQTVNKTVGSVNFAAGATSLVVTNNRVTTASVIVATVATNDSTMKSVTAVAASGSFTITANVAATAETRVNFIVIN